MKAVGACCLYLEQLLLQDKVLPVSSFSEVSRAASDVLSLDAKALSQLEILTSQEGDTRGSLLGCIDSTTTAGGKRLLRRWIVSPLRCIDSINMRLDAVSWLLQHQDVLELIRSSSSSLPDLERLTARCLRQGRQQKRHAVYFDDVHQKELKLFVSLLNSFSSLHDLAAAVVVALEKEPPAAAAAQAAAAAAAAGEDPVAAAATAAAAAAAAAQVLWPHRLWALCAGRDKGGVFPKLKDAFDKLITLFTVEGDSENEKIYPVKVSQTPVSFSSSSVFICYYLSPLCCLSSFCCLSPFACCLEFEV